MAVGALGAVTATAGDARTSVRPRADLTVSRGALTLASGRITGTVVVRNAGRRRAPATSVSIVVRSGGRDRSAGRVAVPALKAGTARSVRVSLRAPSGTRLPATARACADARGVVHERAEANNCRSLGAVAAPKAAPGPFPAAKPPVAAPAPAPAPVPVSPIDPGGLLPVSSVPAAPIPYTPDEPFALGDSWMVVPSSYDKTHQTPTELFVWMHGCYGEAEGDAYTVMPQPDDPYIAISLGGRDGGCWDVDADQGRVLAAIAEVKSHFNIDPGRVVLGGYSSGGDLSYRLAFYHSTEFAGVLAENTSPFKDTGSTQTQSLAAATFKFHVVHLAHTEDEAYAIDQVRQETDAMAAAGFPITRIERPGLHNDANTDSDLQTLLLPHLADGWRAPVPVPVAAG